MKLNYKVGIATKIIMMVTTLVVLSIGVVVYIASDLFQEESLTRVQEVNAETADFLGDRLRFLFKEGADRLKLMAQFATTSLSHQEALRGIRNTLEGSDDVISFFAYQFDQEGHPKLMFSVVDDAALAEFNMKIQDLESKPLPAVLKEKLENLSNVTVTNISPQLQIPMFSISFMSQVDGQTEIKVASDLRNKWFFRAEMRLDPVLRLFMKKKMLNSFLVNSKGQLLAHSSPDKMSQVMQAADVSTLPIVWELTQGNSNNHQMEYVADGGEVYLGSFKKLGISGLGVVAEVKKSKALATIKRVQYRSILVMIIVLCLAFCLNFLFSQSLTSPLKKLFEATRQIVDGNYKVNLNLKSSDEIGALGSAFSNMVDGLKEREKLKGAFNKFHSKEVAQKLLSGEIKLGGEKKHATVFFSDIRGFTALSETLTPDQVVSMLNEYMTAMVQIIFKWHGVVDKYIGDAIMAVWGVPNTRPEDTYNAVRACLEMRDYLYGYNQERQDKGLYTVEIGMGLHTGDVLAGNIGSEERLEYTVIGDTVNQASRIEGANKPLGSDILISEETYLLVKDKGIVTGPCVAISAKGKSEAVRVYKVIGYKNESGELITTLSQEQIQKVEAGAKNVELAEEEKTSLHLVDSDKSSEPQEEKWHVIKSETSQESLGLFTLKEIKLKVKSCEFNPGQYYAYKEGEFDAIPLWKLPGMEQRMEMPPITERLPSENIQKVAKEGQWFIHGNNERIFGPFDEKQLRMALENDNIKRTAYVWQKGLEHWIYLYEIPGFDRRKNHNAA